MSDGSKIEWTDATWNPITGCSLVSEGCRNCYAAELAASRLRHHPSRAGLARRNADGVAKFTGEVRLNEEWLGQPLRWARPRRIFVCAHGDLFHESVPDEWIDGVFAIMALCPQHTFQVLTKRPERMRDYCSSDATLGRVISLANSWLQSDGKIDVQHKADGFGGIVLPNVWLGTSVEDQATADARIPLLLAMPAAKRFISAEPLLGAVDLTALSPNGIQMIDALRGWSRAPEYSGWPRLDWVIVGGESGRNARPMHPDWVRSLRDQCAGAEVPFFFKQWGEWLPREPEHGPCWKSQNGKSEDHHTLFPDDIADDPKGWDSGLSYLSDGNEHAAFQRVGKKAAGALLDGREHREMPE